MRALDRAPSSGGNFLLLPNEVAGELCCSSRISEGAEHANCMMFGARESECETVMCRAVCAVGSTLVIGVARREAEGTQDDSFLPGAFGLGFFFRKMHSVLGTFNMSILKCIFLYRVNCVSAIPESHPCNCSLALVQI